MAEPTVEKLPESVAPIAEGDAVTTDSADTQKMLKAASQSKIQGVIDAPPFFVDSFGILVEFYFADSNLPYDK